MTSFCELVGIRPMPAAAEQFSPAAVGREVVLRPMASVQPAGGGREINTSAELDAYLREGADTAAGVNVTPETAMRVAAVFGCVRIISGAVATLPLQIKRKLDHRTREDADDHAVAKLFRRRPNAWMKPAQFKRMLQAHKLLRGNAYCLKVFGVGGRLIALHPLHPDRVHPRQRPDGLLEYVYHRPGGGTIVYQQAEIFHLMGMTLDGIVGVSVLTYARETIGLALATSRHGAGFFKNGTHIGTVIRHPHKVGLEGIEFLKASLEEFRSGGEREHKTLILEEAAELERLGMTAADAQFVETLGLTRTEIAMFFGVPPHMLGDTAKSTSWGAGIEAQARGFVAFTLEDWLTGWEEGVNADLIGDDEPDIYARFNRNALVRGDLKTRWAAYVAGLQWGVYSPNKVLEMEDENPREGGDVFYPPPNTAGKAAGDEPADPDDKKDSLDDPSDAA